MTTTVTTNSSVVYAVPVLDHRGRLVMQEVVFNGRKQEVPVAENVRVGANVSITVDDALASELIKAGLARKFDPVLDDGPAEDGSTDAAGVLAAAAAAAAKAAEEAEAIKAAALAEAEAIKAAAVAEAEATKATTDAAATKKTATAKKSTETDPLA